MKTDNRFRDLDDAALIQALLALRVCPTDRQDLRPVALVKDVWGCARCHETWYLQTEGESHHVR